MKKIILTLFLLLISFLNSEAQWFTQQSGTTNPLYDIKFINRNTGWACGEDGYIIKTTNGGVNWIQQGFGVNFRPLFGIHPVDSNTVYAVGFFRTVVKTTDGGTTWNKIESGMQGDGRYTCVYFLNQNTGWIGNFDSPEYGVRKTTNGGNTFFSIPFSGIPQDLYFKDSLNGIGVGGLSYIYKTTDGGLNWNSFSLVFTGDFYRVSFINNYIGYTASRRAVYKTINFGTNWDSVGNIPVTLGSVLSVEFCNENTGWAGTQYQIFNTTNGGRDWFSQIGTGVIYSIYSFNDSLVWACGNGGRIWHTMNGGTSNILNISNSIPSMFELYQNYPNPFNSQTKIKIDIRKRGYYEMETFNNAGKKIETIFNGELNTGQFEITYDAKELSSGIYFYRLSGNNISETKKLILIK